jgi:hypothetical protein
MENRKPSNYNFITQVLLLFAFDVLFLMINAKIFGEGAQTISNLYQFGSKGLSIDTLLQFLLSSVVIIFFKSLFMSERYFKNVMMLWRTIFMLFCILSSVIVFIIVFRWFPLDNVSAWTGFILCFVIGFFGSTLFMIIKTKRANKKYDELLSNYQNQHGGNPNE